jgi:hypothetical protein
MDREYKFDTTTGEGSEIVTVVVSYEIDEDGVYNDNIEKILFEGVDVLGLMHEDQYSELEMEASMRLREHIEESKKPSDFGMP